MWHLNCLNVWKVTTYKQCWIRNMHNATLERLWTYCGTLSALCTFLRIILLCDKSLWWLKCTTAYNYIKLLPLPTSKWSNFQFASPILCKKSCSSRRRQIENLELLHVHNFKIYQKIKLLKRILFSIFNFYKK